MDIRRPKTEPQEKYTPLEERKKERKTNAKIFFYHIRSAKSVPAIEFDVDEEADENPRPVEWLFKRSWTCTLGIGNFR